MTTPTKTRKATTAKATANLMYRLARHIRNPDQLAPIEWGAAGRGLLVEVRNMNPRKYAKLLAAARHSTKGKGR